MGNPSSHRYISANFFEMPPPIKVCVTLLRIWRRVYEYRLARMYSLLDDLVRLAGFDLSSSRMNIYFCAESPRIGGANSWYKELVITVLLLAIDLSSKPL